MLRLTDLPEVTKHTATHACIKEKNCGTRRGGGNALQNVNEKQYRKKGEELVHPCCVVSSEAFPAVKRLK